MSKECYLAVLSLSRFWRIWTPHESNKSFVEHALHVVSIQFRTQALIVWRLVQRGLVMTVGLSINRRSHPKNHFDQRK